MREKEIAASKLDNGFRAFHYALGRLVPILKWIGVTANEGFTGHILG